jgi:hypothetical protein
MGRGRRGSRRGNSGSTPPSDPLQDLGLAVTSVGTSPALNREVARTIQLIPRDVRALLGREGTSLTIAATWADTPIRKMKDTTRGVFAHNTSGTVRKAFSIEKPDGKTRRHGRDVAATALHELGHAVDFRVGAAPLSKSEKFRTAVAADQKEFLARVKQFKIGKTNAESLTYRHYDRKERASEVFAEVFATAYGARRSGGLNRAVQKLFPATLSAVIELTEGIVP